MNEINNNYIQLVKGITKEIIMKFKLDINVLTLGMTKISDSKGTRILIGTRNRRRVFDKGAIYDSNRDGIISDKNLLKDVMLNNFKVYIKNYQNS